MLDFLKLADPALAKQYSARPKADPTPKRRAKVIEGIDRTIQQLRANEESPKRGWYSSRSYTINTTGASVSCFLLTVLRVILVCKF